ncbi:MAG: BMP family ABC transporter substrate-binding protein [Treponema sp.]|nr:BMP family ABC transporter substrate-binding protein [Treponema sp.]
MKKIIFCLALAGVIAGSVFLGACQRRTPGALSGVTVRLLTDATGIDDRSFNAAAWRGILEFYGDSWARQTRRGSLYDVITAQTQDMYIPNLRLATDEGHDLIVTTGFTWASALEEVAAQNPHQNYMIVDVDWVNLPNVMQATFSEHEGSFLVGVAAALKAQADGINNPRFGFIGGVPGPVITKFHVGYVQGVLSVIPNAQFVDYYTNDWGRPDLAKTQAMNWYDAGVYIIYSAAGASGNGTIAQAKEYREVGRNVWAIGVDSDQHDEGLYTATDSAVLTSMLKRVESSLLYSLRAVAADNFSARTIIFDLAAEGVGYATTNSAMTPDIVNRLEQYKQEIVSGQRLVAATYAEARRLPGFPQNLQARD